MAFDQRPSSTVELRIDVVCDRFEAAWKAGQRPSIQEHIGDWSDPELSSLLHELLLIDLAYRTQDGETPARAEYEAIFPQHLPAIASAFAEAATSREVTSRDGRGSSTARRDRPETSPSHDAEVQPTSLSDEQQPTKIDRYRVLELLAVGGFGTVYLGYDDQLKRKVAIKVPRMDRVAEPESFLMEAQVLASLDHPNIVDVYDAGQTSDGRFYIVSKWMEGTDLSQVAKVQPLPYRRCAELVAKIADALHCAHGRKLVHRDIKPANILIDSTGEPQLADFGLALSEEDVFGRQGASGGTAAYMSPEQARGEGHLVDGRSDIFSLGAVFYRLLTGERPFRGSSPEKVMDRIRTQEARPPRQLHADLPKELERICLKALSRQAKDRYTTAFDMADDLRHFLRADSTRAAQSAAGAVPTPDGQRQRAARSTVVPKGLRSFDRNDADFFLQLLPGPYCRDGLPEAIRFWKMRIEERDAEYTFRVGLIYGPSGCGATSLVRAGLLPRLADHVEKIYIECNGVDDEQRLLRGLRRRIDGPELGGLTESLAAIRRGQGMPAGRKLLIVLDQFEQWLHAHRAKENAELIDALRQCDGERVQCILLARDDFWMAITRFMRQLDEPIVEGHNAAAVHLFDPLHARKVLAEFGRSFGRLPHSLEELSSDQTKFLDQAISDLARDGEIIPVRLTLFADMVKGKPWTLATLKRYGGTGGIITFLEESFSATTALPAHRLHESAARSVLRALLPESGANLKGCNRSHTELLEVSGYRERPQQFDDLMRILDNDMRLLTPIEPASAAERSQQPRQPASSERYYHLTHDYLVQPLREWLTLTEKVTRRGRAALALAERSELWNAKPENCRLPSLWEFMNIWWFTRNESWTAAQRKMFHRARRYHGLRVSIAVILITVLLCAGLRLLSQNQHRTAYAAALVGRLMDAENLQPPGLVTEIESCRE